MGTDFEILKFLWKQSPLSGREIHDRIAGKTGWAYSTTRTVIERMVKKGLLEKDESHGLNVYCAKISRASAFASQIASFAERLLDGDAEAMIPLFTKGNVLNEHEISELKDIIKTMEKKQ